MLVLFCSDVGLWLTFEVDGALGSADDLDGLVVGLVALQPHALGAHEALLALQHQDGPANSSLVSN